MPMEERLEQKELTSAVVKTMKNHLSDVEQKALIMFANDYTQNEIAKELGVSQANVSKLIKLTRHRVILHLRRNGYVF
jgi:RNA polymerase sigma factor (sigma-70 family)